MLGFLSKCKILSSGFLPHTLSGRFLGTTLSRPNIIGKFTKIVHPGDSQMFNMVQGGLVLKFLEEAADIAATKHCLKYGVKSASGAVPQPTLVGVERIEMLGTAETGDLLEYVARIIYVKPRSLRIHVDAHCRSYKSLDKKKRLVTKASLWYVPIQDDGKIGHFEMPEETNDLSVQKQQSMKSESPYLANYLDMSMQMYMNTLEKGKDKKAVDDLNKLARELLLDPERAGRCTMYAISPSHCGLLGTCRAGEILRWMDEFAGVSSSHLSNRIGVTGSVDNCIMSKPVLPGSCVTFVGRRVFKSKRTVDVQVIGCLENQHTLVPEVFTSGFFTFVHPNADEAEAPPLELHTDESIRLYEEREALYTSRKALIKNLKEMNSP